MGFYSFGRVKIISRNGTKSAVATAAYHAGISLKNEYDGVTHDYSDKRDVKGTFIRMPDTAPERWRDESIPAKERVGIIWNDVERAQPAANAQLARSNYIALPHNLTIEQALECVDRFIAENCTSKGMAVTYSLHDKPNNRHVDVMYLMREYDESGKPKEKAKKEYLCRNKDGQERYMDAKTLQNAKGYEKVYKYKKAGEKRNMTPSEASAAGEWQRINKYPVCRTVKVGGWDDKELAKTWRKSWEEILNDKYAELGMKDRVDSRSYKDRGLGIMPTVHVGYGPGSKERKAHNQEVRQFRKDVGAVYLQGRNLLKSVEYQITDLKNNRQTKETLTKHEADYAAKQHTLEKIVQSGFFSSAITEKFKEKIRDLSHEMRILINSWHDILKRLPEANKKPTETNKTYPEIAERAERAEKAVNDIMLHIKKATNRQKQEKQYQNRDNAPER